MSETDRIVKTVVLRAPQSRVWRAISDSTQFGDWFGMELEGPFVAGQPIKGRIAPTKADPEVAKSQAPYAGKPVDFVVDRIEPERLFSFRWHPFAVEPNVDYSNEPTTLIEFELAAVDGGTKLTITESGFDRIPLARRAKAFAMNDQGWTAQCTMIAKYLAHGA